MPPHPESSTAHPTVKPIQKNSFTDSFSPQPANGMLGGGFGALF